MIIDIKKGSFAKGLISYHEKKVEKGRGERLLDTTLSRSKEERIQSFLEVAEGNTRVKKNKFMHVSVSFSKEDQPLSKEQQLKLAEQYLDEMGYKNTPRLIYEHWDTKHNHFHIVTTTIDFDGKKISEFKDFERSQELSRRIEKQYGLTVTEYYKQEGQKLQEINAKKFKVLKGFEKIINDPNAQERISKVLNADELDRVMAEKLSDNQIQDLLRLRGIEERQFNQLYRIIREFDAEYRTDKDQLRERLNYIKDISRSREEFMANAEKQGIYVRKISTGDNTVSVTYGIPQKNFYVTDKDLPVALRYDYLFTDRKITQTFDQASQKKFLKGVVSRSLKMSSTLEGFEAELRKAGINYEYSSNARGVYGISFSSNNIKDPMLIKGSEIGVSWNRLVQELNIPKQPTVSKTQVPAKDKSIDPAPLHIPKSVSKALDTSNDDEEKRKKRKNRDQDMDREQ
jgi:hypothetical protein